MIFHIPVYVVGHQPAGRPARVFHARPLFFPGPQYQHENLSRLLMRMARGLTEELDRLGRLAKHDLLAAYSFRPPMTQHRLDLTLDLRRRTAKCRFLFVAFRHMDRRLAFTPSVPDRWFEIGRNEPLRDRAAEVLTEYFREQEREGEDEAIQPEAVSVHGSAWVETIDLNVSPPALVPKVDPLRFLMIGGGEKADGAMELRRVGRCLDWLYPDELDRVLLRDPEAEELARLLEASDRRPVLLVGPRLVGKTALVHECVYRRVAERRSPYQNRDNVWLLSPQRLISGMSYVGQWEDRLLAILKEARRRGHVLYFDDLLGLFQAGLTCNSTLSVAAVLKPYVERRDVRVLGEITPEALRVLRERDRSFADLFHLLPLREPTDAETLRVLIGVRQRLEAQHPCRFDLEVIPTVLDLQRRYERNAAFPGKAARLMRQLAVKGAQEAEADAEREPGDAAENRHEANADASPLADAPLLTRDSVLAAFQAQSGLSLSFLDGRTRLDRSDILDALRKQVVGQDAALEAAADVIAVARARLNDPDRPLASFLFLGPTGVGKTETAKAIARYLFGDAERLLRFDMNEFVNPGSAARLVGTFAQPEGLLTAAVRRQPFSVVLLDEIEKADPEVFDLLLQVLGEGRLTDALGRTADFTNAIVLLTSNLGVREAEGRFGFRADESAARAAVFVRAAERFFRPEFFNRLDRVIPFGRLDRAHVRRIADRLLHEVLGREGFQQRKCMLNVDPAALERVVEVGYDPQLGARAMKRAIERHLTQPVAARLAALPVDAFTVVGVWPGREAGFGEEPQQAHGPRPVGLDSPSPMLAVHVQALEQVPPIVLQERRTLEPAGRLGRIATALARIEESFAGLGPTGPVAAADLMPEHYRYFALRGQADRVREGRRRLAERLERQLLARVPLPPYRDGERFRPPKIVRYDFTGGHLLQEMAGALNLQEFLRELADSARPADADEAAWGEVERQLALLRAMADGGEEEAILVVRRPDSANAFVSGFGLDAHYLAAFGEPLGLDASRLNVRDVGVPESDRVVLLRGPIAGLVARREAGTHLLCPQHDSTVPAQVFGLPIPADRQPADVLAEHYRRHDDWRWGLAEGRASVEENPFAFGPVVRIYGERSGTFDLRTGLAAPTPPGPEALQSFVLSALPIPKELRIEN